MGATMQGLLDLVIHLFSLDVVNFVTVILILYILRGPLQELTLPLLDDIRAAILTGLKSKDSTIKAASIVSGSFLCGTTLLAALVFMGLMSGVG